jgi:hypothetical protein
MHVIYHIIFPKKLSVGKMGKISAIAAAPALGARSSTVAIPPKRILVRGKSVAQLSWRLAAQHLTFFKALVSHVFEPRSLPLP